MRKNVKIVKSARKSSGRDSSSAPQNDKMRFRKFKFNFAKISIASLMIVALAVGIWLNFGANPDDFAKADDEAATIANCHTATAEAAHDLCFIDWANLDYELATSATGQKFTVALGDNYTLNFTLKISAGDYGLQPMSVISGNSVRTAYFGITGQWQIYTGNAGWDGNTRPANFVRKSASYLKYDLENITVANPDGAVENYQIAMADLETTGLNTGGDHADDVNKMEGWIIESDQPVDILETIVNGGGIDDGVLESCLGGLFGVGTTQLECWGSVSDMTAATWPPDNNIFSVDNPTTLRIDLQKVLDIGDNGYWRFFTGQSFALAINLDSLQLAEPEPKPEPEPTPNPEPDTKPDLTAPNEAVILPPNTGFES